jgi:hypothetical protein
MSIWCSAAFGDIPGHHNLGRLRSAFARRERVPFLRKLLPKGAARHPHAFSVDQARHWRPGRRGGKESFGWKRRRSNAHLGPSPANAEVDTRFPEGQTAQDHLIEKAGQLRTIKDDAAGFKLEANPETRLELGQRRRSGPCLRRAGDRVVGYRTGLWLGELTPSWLTLEPAPVAYVLGRTHFPRRATNG